MLDYDNDGYLDIYVTNYGSWNYPEDHHRVGDAEKKVWLYSSPRTIKTAKHLFYHNNGNLTFTDVYDKVITAEKDVEGPQDQGQDPMRVPKPRDDGHGFGVVAADVNDDGLIDIYVANDMNPNFLFLNRGDGTFDDVSELSGAAFDINGQAQSGMGVDAEDVDGDGLPELFVTNFANEYNTLYQNYRQGDLLRQHGLLRPGVRHDAVGRLGLRPGRLRQRRLARLLRRQRPRRQQPHGCSASRSTTRRSPCCSATSSGQAVPAGDPRRRALLRHQARRPRARPSATSTTTATSTSSSTTRTARRPCSATTPSRRTTGSASSSRGPRATATPSAPRSRSRSTDQLADPPAERTIYRQRKGGYSMQGTNDPRVLVGVGPGDRGQEGRDPLAVGDRQHPGEPQGRPGLQGRRAQGRQARAAPGEAREEGRADGRTRRPGRLRRQALRPRITGREQAQGRSSFALRRRSTSNPIESTEASELLRTTTAVFRRLDEPDEAACIRPCRHCARSDRPSVGLGELLHEPGEADPQPLHAGLPARHLGGIHRGAERRFLEAHLGGEEDEQIIGRRVQRTAPARTSKVHRVVGLPPPHRAWPGVVPARRSA